MKLISVNCADCIALIQLSLHDDEKVIREKLKISSRLCAFLLSDFVRWKILYRRPHGMKIEMKF
jgi:hypothetical protein